MWELHEYKRGELWVRNDTDPIIGAAARNKSGDSVRSVGASSGRDVSRRLRMERHEHHNCPRTIGTVSTRRLQACGSFAGSHSVALWLAASRSPGSSSAVR